MAKVLREWKKVFESDLAYVTYEVKELTESPCVIFLEGNLGAGKTAFSKSFVAEGDTLSPTYSIISETNDVLHADFYRLETKQEVFELEIEHYLEGKNYCLIEWGAKFHNTLINEFPDQYKFYRLDIEINDSSQSDSSRNFALSELEDDLA